MTIGPFPSPLRELQSQNLRRSLETTLKETTQAQLDATTRVEDPQARFISDFLKGEPIGGAGPTWQAPPVEAQTQLIPRAQLDAAADVGSASNPAFWGVVKDLLQPGLQGEYGKQWGVSTDNLVSQKVLVDPKVVWSEFARLVPYAKSEIGVQTFAWASDSEPAKTFLDSLSALQERRKAEGATTPIKVRIMIDEMNTGLNGNLKPKEMRENLEEEVRKRGLDPRLVDVSIGLFIHKLGGSQHGKSAYIDNRVALVTGSNMNDADDFETGEHDSGFLYGGEAPNAARVDFDQTWAQCQVTEQSMGNWTTSAPGTTPVVHNFSSIPKWTEAVKNPKDPIDELLATMKPNVPMAYLSKAPNDHLFLREKNPAASLNKAMVSMIHHATTGYKFASANLNEPQIVEALIDAAFRHVKVQGLATQGYEDIAESFSGGTNAAVVNRIYERLEKGFAMKYQREGLSEEEALKKGAEEARTYFDFRFTRYDPNQQKADVGHAPHSSHVKYSSADDQVAYNGSLNLDTQSWARSRELGVLVGDEETIKAWNEQLFDRDFERAVAIPDPDALKATNLGSLLRSARIVEEGTAPDANLWDAIFK